MRSGSRGSQHGAHVVSLRRRGLPKLHRVNSTPRSAVRHVIANPKEIRRDSAFGIFSVKAFGVFHRACHRQNAHDGNERRRIRINRVREGQVCCAADVWQQRAHDAVNEIKAHVDAGDGVPLRLALSYCSSTLGCKLLTMRAQRKMNPHRSDCCVECRGSRQLGKRPRFGRSPCPVAASRPSSGSTCRPGQSCGRTRAPTRERRCTGAWQANRLSAQKMHSRS